MSDITWADKIYSDKVYIVKCTCDILKCTIYLKFSITTIRVLVDKTAGSIV